MTTAVCFDKAAKKDDLDLNRLYGELQKKLEEDDWQKLRIAQRLWLKFRDATCAAEPQLYTTGSAAPTVYSACLEAQTRQRIKDLHTTYDWLLSKSGDLASHHRRATHRKTPSMKCLINGDFGNLPALIAATASSDAARRGMRLRIWVQSLGV